MGLFVLLLPFSFLLTSCASAKTAVERTNTIARQQQMLAYFSYWQTKYVRASYGNTPGGGLYVYMQGNGPNGEISITTSEAHGYGMMIYAHLGDQAKFDGFFNMFHHHRSSSNPFTMSWIIDKTERKRYASATDGDLDIAYALILAHRRWGSSGTVNYLNEAKNLLQHGIKPKDFSSSGRTNLGDWDKGQFHSRPSDWMPSHFETFYQVTGDEFWKRATVTVYDLIGEMQSRYSPVAGLLPDFIVGRKPRPAPRGYLGEDSVDFSWNACRFPFRLTLDYALHGRSEAKQSLAQGLKWIVAKTGGDPEKIKAGYFLDGTAQVNYSDSAFIAPWVAAATTDPRYSAFVERGWDYLIRTKSSYYSDTITLMVLIYLSNNWKDNINPS